MKREIAFIAYMIAMLAMVAQGSFLHLRGDQREWYLLGVILLLMIAYLVKD